MRLTAIRAAARSISSRGTARTRSAFNATPFFTNKARAKKPVSRFNQYGGSLSGPVTIPKLFNGRNKVFFMFAYEGVKDALPAPSTNTMPTDAQRSGNFSALLGVGAIYQLFDPLTGVAQGGRVARKLSRITSFPPIASRRLPRTTCNTTCASRWLSASSFKGSGYQDRRAAAGPQSAAVPSFQLTWRR